MKVNEVPTFETLIENLGAETQERLRNEFQRLSENGRESFNKLFALAYGHGQIDGAEAAKGIAREQIRRIGIL